MDTCIETIDFKLILSLRKLERWRRGVFSVPVYNLLEHFQSRFQMWTFHFALNASFSLGFGNGLISESGILISGSISWSGYTDTGTKCHDTRSLSFPISHTMSLVPSRPRAPGWGWPQAFRLLPPARIWILATYDVVRHDIVLNIVHTMSYVRYTGCRRTTSESYVRHRTSRH